MPHVLRTHNYGLDDPGIRPGIYLDGVNKTLIDVGGDNLAITNGKIVLTNNTARVYGRGNGQIEWLKITSEYGTGFTPTATATVRVKYNCLDASTTGGPTSWDTPMNYFIGDPDTVCTDWEFNTWDGTATVVKVYRGAYDVQSGFIMPDMPSVTDRIRKIIAERCAPNFIRDRRALDHAPDIREIRARQTLRRVIGEDKFRGFITKGFITVRAKSGKTYQIFPGHGITNVYVGGKMLEKLCVVLSGNFPPTDSLIMRYLLILNNEDQFRSLANVSAPSVPYKALPKEPDKRTLVEIFKAFKNPLKNPLKKAA